MSHSELNFGDAIFVFETVMRVRHTEIDVSQHLSLEALSALLTEARARFLYAKGIQDIDAGHQGLIVDCLQLNVVSVVRERDELLFEVGIDQICDDGSYIAIKVTRMADNSLVATARQHMVNYDYRLNKTVPLSSCTKERFEQHVLQP